MFYMTIFSIKPGQHKQPVPKPVQQLYFTLKAQHYIVTVLVLTSVFGLTGCSVILNGLDGTRTLIQLTTR